MIKIENYYSAKVIDNNDPDKEGKVKVFCEVFMEGISEDLYPWVRPWIAGPGGSKDFGGLCVPEKDSQILVFFSNDELKHHGFYVADASFKDLNAAKAFEDKVKPQVGRWKTEYPDVKYMIHKNGTCIAMSSNSDTPEIVIVAPNGAQFLITKDGNLFAGKNGNTMDPVVSTTKLKNYLLPIVGNLGGPLFAATITTTNISFDDFFGGMDPSTPTPSFTPPQPPDASVPTG